jgi:maltose-binding protein MalE
MSPAGQLATHTELEQKGVAAGHAMPQAPQLAPSAAVFAQASPQALSGAAQEQAALTQVCIAPQAVAH